MSVTPSDFSNARALLASVLDLAPVSIKDDSSIENLEEWDSLAHMRLIVAIEARLKREMSPLEIADLTSIVEIEKILALGAD